MPSTGTIFYAGRKTAACGLEFNESTTILDALESMLPSDNVFTAIVVFQRDSGGTNQMLFGVYQKTTNSRYAGFMVDGNGKWATYWKNDATANHMATTNVITNGQPQIGDARGTGSQHLLGLNGQAETVVETSGTNDGSWTEEITVEDRTAIGAWGGLTPQYTLDGLIGVIAYYKGVVLSDEELDFAIRQEAAYYGITV